MSNVVLNILSEFKGKKAFKQADTAVGKLNKSVKALGVTLSAVALTQFSVKAVKAFAADEKAAVKLSQAVKNLGLGFADARVAAFIADLEKTANVADDQLRPAFQALLTTTGSLTRSQELLNLAIETSRGSGVDLVTTAQDIAQAYVGNTRGLRKYNLGLTQAELKTASFATIQAKLNAQFQGANAAYLDTTAGKIEAIGIAAGNAAETIGGSLVDAIMTLSNTSTTSGLTKGIENITGYVTGLINSVAFAIFSIKSLFNTKYWKSGGGDQIFKDFEKLMNMRKLAAARPYDPGNNAVTGYQRDNAAMIKAEADAKKRAAAIVAAQKKNTAELKKQNAEKKRSALFDLSQIQIIAALKGNISKEERLRLELQLALINGNEEQAAKLSRELANSIDSTGNLAKYLATLPDANNPFKNWDTWLASFKAQLAAVVVTPPPSFIAPPSTNAPSDDSGFRLPDTLPGQSGSGAQFGPDTPWARAGAQSVVVQIDGKAIASALLDQSMSAGQVAYLDRRTGGF